MIQEITILLFSLVILLLTLAGSSDVGRMTRVSNCRARLTRLGRVCTILFAASLSLLAIEGCSGGWGEAKPIITSSIAGKPTNAGQVATLSVFAAGTGPFKYQWYENGAPIAGATSNSYSATVAASENGNVFTVAVTNAAGTSMSAPYMLTVNSGPAITIQPANQTVMPGQTAALSVTATGTAPLNYQWYQNGAPINGATSSSYTTPATTIANSGSLFTVSVTNLVGTVTSAQALLTVPPLHPALTFTPITSHIYGDAAFPVSATSASSGVVTYSVASGPAIVSGSTVTITGAGTVILNASQAANGNYAAATASTQFTVGSETPALTFAPIASHIYGDAAFPVSANSASSGVVTYSVASGPAIVSGSTVTITGAGTVILNASQAANGNYAAATASTQFTVGSETPALTFVAIASHIFGDADFPVSATSASSGAVTYSVASGPAIVSGSTVTLTGAGTVVLNASQAANGNYATAIASTQFTVGSETPALTFVAIASHIFGDADFPVSATSASSGAVTYSVASGPAIVSGSTVTLTGAGTVVLNASQAANGNYAAATASTQFIVTVNVSLSAISPADQTMAPGQQSFSTTVTGGMTNHLNWTATGGTIDANGVWTAPNAPGVYRIKATSVDQPSVSVTTTVTVSLPVIRIQPISQNLCGYGNILLSVTADYASSYQWYLNGTVLTGATNSTYSVSSATTAEAGNYTVVAINPAGSTTSGIATEVVGSSITNNPANLTVSQYQTAAFNLAAIGKTPFTYQWYSVASGSTTASAVAGATSSTYITPVETSTTPAGQPVGYYATVTDTCGNTLTSATADLTVVTGNSPPTITTQPTGQTVPSGSTATFSATAVGSGTLSYQWYRIPQAGTNQEITGATPSTGAAVAGATSATYTVAASATKSSNDQDVYYVQVTNAYGEAVSQHATLAVDSGVQIQITDQPVNAYVNAGASASFTVTASSTLPLTYQWYMVPPGQSAAAQSITTASGPTTTKAEAVAIAGATGATYTLPAATASQTGAVYYAVVSNGQTASVISNSASLFVGTLAGIPSCSSEWNLLGTTTGFNSGNCSYQLTAAQSYQYGEIVWPNLISTGNIQLSFTITTSNPSSPPADGFAVVLGDPSLGAKLNSAGQVGEGLGARGIPGFVVAFDDFFNTSCTSGCNPAPYPTDPSTSANPDYLGVGRGEESLWESPYFNVNTNLPVSSGDSYALAQYGKTISHNYVVNIVSGYMSVSMDGRQVFSGNVSVPPVAYLYVTSSTGGSWEQTVISNISATVSAPSN